MELKISINNHYVNLNLGNRTIRYLVSPALDKYKKIKKFDKKNGILTLVAHYIFPDKTETEEEDWIDLKNELGFAYKTPEDIINNIHTIKLV